MQVVTRKTLDSLKAAVAAAHAKLAHVPSEARLAKGRALQAVHILLLLLLPATWILLPLRLLLLLLWMLLIGNYGGLVGPVGSTCRAKCLTLRRA